MCRGEDNSFSLFMKAYSRLDTPLTFGVSEAGKTSLFGKELGFWSAASETRGAGRC